MMIKRKIFIPTAMLQIGSWTATFAQNECNVLPAEVSDANNIILNDTVAHQVSEQILFRIGKSTIDSSYMDTTTRQALLAVIDNHSYPVERFKQIQALCAYQATFKRLQTEMAIGLLNEPSNLSRDNWTLLRERIAASDIANKDSILNIIDNTPIANGREQQLKALEGSESYHQLLYRFIPELLIASREAQTALKSEVLESGATLLCDENWNSLCEMISASNMPDRDMVLDMIDNEPNVAVRSNKLLALNGGQTYRFINEVFCPEAKQRTKERATAVVQRQAAEHQPEQPIQDPITTSITTPAQAKSWRPFIALKTDLMLWGGVMPGFEIGTWTPNLSAEIYFARRWSVQAGYAYSNWNKSAGTKELYAVSAADMEVCRWFGKQSQFKGFYLGVYGQYGQYDIQKGIQGQAGSFWSAGLGAGWMQPLSRHWALEAEIRGGYRSAQNTIHDVEQWHTYFNNEQTIGRFTPQFRLQVVYRIGKTQK